MSNEITIDNGIYRKKRGILFLFLCLFLLLSSGRMDSGDANAELAGSFNLIENRSLGRATPYSDEFIQSLFVRAPNGRYYEAHDIGNSLLLTPAAFGGVALGTKTVNGGVRLQTLIAKTIASLIETALSAVGCFYLYLLFGLSYKRRPTLLLTVVFVFATFYTAYFRTAWDVLPACNVLIILLYYSARLVLAETVGVQETIPIAFWFGIVCMFRLSLAPFLGIGLVILIWSVRKRVSLRAVLTAISTATIMFVPTLFFNMIRTGSPLRPASTLPQFHYQTGLTGSLVQGMFGLLLSPNRGLLVFSPILLLLVLLPRYWKSMPVVVTSLLRAYLFPVFLYYLMIAKMHNWGAAGWGPRYLLPVLPILFLGAGAIAYQLWCESRARRRMLITLCSIAFLLSIPTLLVDYSNAVLLYPDAFSGTTPYPVQHIAVWKNLVIGLQGRPQQVRPNVGTAEDSKLLMVFPDLLVMRVFEVVAERSKVGAEIFLLLYVSALGYVAYLLWCVAGRRETLKEDDSGVSERAHIQKQVSAFR